VDTTAAGDTFTGFFLAQITASGNAQLALQQASIASGISVSRKGASASIPQMQEVLDMDPAILQPFGG
jgi:ribokinase